MQNRRRSANQPTNRIVILQALSLRSATLYPSMVHKISTANICTCGHRHHHHHLIHGHAKLSLWNAINKCVQIGSINCTRNTLFAAIQFAREREPAAAIAGKVLNNADPLWVSLYGVLLWVLLLKSLGIIILPMNNNAPIHPRISNFSKKSKCRPSDLLGPLLPFDYIPGFGFKHRQCCCLLGGCWRAFSGNSWLA